MIIYSLYFYDYLDDLLKLTCKSIEFDIKSEVLDDVYNSIPGVLIIRLCQVDVTMLSDQLLPRRFPVDDKDVCVILM